MAEPKVRFKRDDGSGYPAWISTPMGTIYRKVNEKNDLSFGRDKIISVANMFFKGSDDRDSLDDEYMKTYNVMRLGDIAFEGHENKEHQYGRFVANTIGDGIVSHIFVVLRPVDVNHNQQYWQYVINNEKVLGPVLRHSTKKSTMMHDLVIDDFLKRKIAVPCLEEQKKIADFLSSVDDVITASEEEVANLETQKKAVMKKIFSQEVRFKRDDGTEFPEWEEKVFTDVAQLINGRAYSANEMLESGKYMILRVGNLFSSNEYYYSDMELDDDKYINEGDLIYAWSATFGPRIYHGEKCIYHYHIWKVIPYSVEKNYFLHFLYADVENLQCELNGGTMKHITKEIMEKRFIPLPCKDEQRLIADFLSDFDEAIAAAKKELELWKELKKGLLQQMFV